MDRGTWGTAQCALVGWWDWFERFRDGAANNVGGDTFRSRVMLKIAEKLGFQTGTMVEVFKNRRLTAFLRPIIWISGDPGGKICKKRLQLLAIRGRF